MSTAPLAFTGVSTFSNDFQTILQREVSIAQLPVKKLQNEEADNLSKKQALIGLNPAVTSLGSAVAALGTLAANKGVTASSSDSSTVSVANTGATSPVTYTVSNIHTLAAAASETTLSGYADSQHTPVSVAGANEIDLTVGSLPVFKLDMSKNNSLTGLRDAINSSGAPVTATILTTGSTNYLSISANSLGATTLQLTDIPSDPLAPPVELITQTNQGANADFYLNGIHITRSSNAVSDVIPGVTFTLLNTTAPTGSVTLTLATDRTQLSNALQTFAQAYNTLVDQVDQQIGPSAGALAGDTLVQNLSDDLRQVGSYRSNGGSIQSLADLGVTFNDNTGHISFDSTKISSLSDSGVSDAFKFLGSPSSGIGLLANNFTQLSDPTTGFIRIQEDGYDRENAQLADQINQLNDRVAAVRASMSAKLQQADALVAELQSEQNTITASVQSLNYVVYGKQLNGAGQ